MEEFFSGIFACILVLYLYIVGPIYSTFNTVDNYIDNHVRTAVNSFQKEVRKNGYVDLDTYNKFLNEVSKTKKLYSINLVHKNKLVYPTENNGFEIHFIENNNNQVLKTIYENKKYYMKYGDDFKVSITEKEEAKGRVLMKSLRGDTKKQYLTFSNGGMIENEVN